MVLAGGGSRRFGRDKALFEVAGRPMASWALEALKPGTTRQVVVANDPRVTESLGVPGRPDRLPGRGPLGGIQAGLEWAREEGLGGIFVLACDLPLVSSKLVGLILRSWPSRATAVVPESGGPLGFEPLCAGYRVDALPIIDELLEADARPVDAALARLNVHRVPASVLGSPGEVGRAFINVNTLESAGWAEKALRLRAAPDSSGRAHGQGAP